MLRGRENKKRREEWSHIQANGRWFYSFFIDISQRSTPAVKSTEWLVDTQTLKAASNSYQVHIRRVRSCRQKATQKATRTSRTSLVDKTAVKHKTSHDDKTRPHKSIPSGYSPARTKTRKKRASIGATEKKKNGTNYRYFLGSFLSESVFSSNIVKK